MKQAAMVLAVVAIVGIGAFFVFGGDDNKKNNVGSSGNPGQAGQAQNISQSDSSNQSSQNSNDPNSYAVNANIGQTVDATGQSQVQVSIDDNIFETTYLKIDKGTNVTWTNNGQMRHDVTSDSASPKGGLASELLANGASYSHTFSEAGVYEYFCTPHANQMRGVITVLE